MSRLVRSATLSRYTEVARSVGLDPLRILAEVGLPGTCLDAGDNLVSASAVCRLLEMSAAASDAEDFGLRLGEGRQLSALGPLGMAVRDSRTLRDALGAMARYITLHSEALFLGVEEREGALVIRLSLMVEHSGSTRQADEMVLVSVYRMLQELMGPGWRARRICLSYRAPRNLASHLRVFGRPVEFGCDFNGIVCELKDMEAVLPAARPELARYAHAYLDSLAARATMSMSEKVRRMVLSLLSSGTCSVERVASQLGVDRRTVHRKLLQEGSTFSSILDEVRASLAVQYLGHLERPVSYVAVLLGFSMQSAFSRWFRGRFGCSPSAWRSDGAQSAGPLPRQQLVAASPEQRV
ncbi:MULTISPECIES: AraC family transcriptional regulator [unclassified Cupriavidus]|uniref:AraC family transcriptional regulator n=1 Tax=unclassified Cupriavidus TaxID=2640874 RepID=UPI000428D36D|nr:MULTISPECIES: AraC family transcriptional regulator [unclassified Cupriavidus]MBP0636195.1 AraC family transcriptional regulator [Cupriavidus sp. AcVe19-6a]